MSFISSFSLLSLHCYHSDYMTTISALHGGNTDSIELRTVFYTSLIDEQRIGISRGRVRVAPIAMSRHFPLAVGAFCSRPT